MAAATAEGRSEKEEKEQITQAIAQRWVPAVFGTFYVIAAPGSVPEKSALGYAAAVYARLLAIKGWFNPALMREKLTEVFFETYELLSRQRQCVLEMEQAIRCGLVVGPEDCRVLCAGAADGRFEEDPRYGILMRYQRERAMCAIALAKSKTPPWTAEGNTAGHEETLLVRS